MTCDEASDGFSAMLDGALPDGERAAVEAHAAGCAACRARRNEIADVRALLRGVDDLEEPVSRTAAVGKSVLARIAGTGARRPGNFGVWLVLAGAAAAGICVFAVVRMTHHDPRTAVPTSTPAVEAPRTPERVPAIHGHLELRASNSTTRDSIRHLFGQWRGTSSVSQPEDAGGFAFVADFDGPDDDTAARFLESLRKFQGDHGDSILSWKFSSSAR